MKAKHARRVPEYLGHILDAIDRATGYVKGMEFAGFEGDTRTQDAVIRSIEIIGEAANKTRVADPDFAARHTHVPWDEPLAYPKTVRLASPPDRVDRLRCLHR